MKIERYKKNPVLAPKSFHSWQAQAVFNGCPVRQGNKIHLVFRALSLPHYHSSARTRLMVSEIGIAESKDGLDFHNRKRLIIPEEPWERFGCEDPRVTKLNGKYYIFYTALSAYPFRAEGIRVGVAVTKDLKNITEKHPVTPFNAKGMTLFPEKINGKMWVAFSYNTDRPPTKFCLAAFRKEEELWSEKFWRNWEKDIEKYSLPLLRRPVDQIEVGAPPLKTRQGWLLFYSYIQNYFLPKKVFGVEAVLLDLKNPLKVLGTTNMPILVPEEYYERIGMVPEVVFPTGALLEGGKVRLYYGAADTTVCLATVELSSVLEKILKKKKTAKALRAKENPILSPLPAHPWEAKATFNPAALYLDGKVHLFYRAMSEDNTSVLGYAASQDGIHIDYRSKDPVFVPREPFEGKLIPGGNSGCEDPRLTRIGNKIYMCYTAFDGKNPPRVALTSISVNDFLMQKWNFSKSALITPPNFDDKDAFIFPERVNGKYFIIHRSGDDIDSAFSPTLDFDGETWIDEYRWVRPRKGMWDSRKVGAAAPPIKTEVGWVLLYHGVSDEDGVYRVGVLLCDLKDPTKIVARSDEPIFEPEAPYETKGQVGNVVFPCGAVHIGEKILIYYGAGDSVVGVATVGLQKLLGSLELCKC